MTKRSPFRYFKTSPEIIRLAVMRYIRYPLSLRNVEDLLHERGIEIIHETVRYWWNRFGRMCAAEILSKRVERMRARHHWRWHLDEVFVRSAGLRTTFGALLVTKVRCWRVSGPRRAIVRPPLNS